MWADLMTDNYEGYGLLPQDDPAEECREWFWATLGEDDVLEKELLEGLIEMCKRIDEGKEELIPVDKNFFSRMEELVNGMNDGDV